MNTNRVLRVVSCDNCKNKVDVEKQIVDPNNKEAVAAMGPDDKMTEIVPTCLYKWPITTVKLDNGKEIKNINKECTFRQGHIDNGQGGKQKGIFIGKCPDYNELVPDASAEKLVEIADELAKKTD